jgi:hypothetical protein
MPAHTTFSCGDSFAILNTSVAAGFFVFYQKNSPAKTRLWFQPTCKIVTERRLARTWNSRETGRFRRLDWHRRVGKTNYPFLTPSILKRFCFLFSEFCLLFLRRQNPVVGNGAKRSEIEASETGSGGFGLRRLDAAFMRPGLTGRGQWRATKQTQNQAGRDDESNLA